MLREIYAHIYKQIAFRMSEKGELAGIFIWPLIGILSLGLFGKFIITEGASQTAIYPLIIGVIAWNFLGIATRTVSHGILYDLWNNCMKHFFNTAIRIRYFILGTTIFALISSLIAFSIILICIILLFGVGAIPLSSYILAGMLIVFLHGVSQGLLICALFISKGYNYQGLSWILPGIMMIVCGVYYPISFLPEWLQTISHLFPSTYAIQGMRETMTGALTTGQTNIAIGFGVAAIHLAISGWLFKKSIQHGKNSGMIANY